ncbi:hypothetical protein [Streptomyces sp. GESEQ-35]|uniref:hypothetical protein n=1 Tax=Streptomyces sp. GESEQ-35 TaxID=2812657 RepID=UPI001B31B071|nr:hypothetical protein [Streptomyces sp. GESEQ-35]
MQADLDALCEHAGVTGASAYIRAPAGIRTAVSAVADTKTEAPMPHRPTLRTASNTKT